MKSAFIRSAILVAVMTGLMSSPALADGTERTNEPLAPVSDFTAITDDDERAMALFGEISKVFEHPRCLNCHTSTDRPFQGEDGRPHIPRVTRGTNNFGVPGMQCNACHLVDSYGRMPGNPTWFMAPISTGWTNFTPGQICEQVKDRERNGGKSLAEVHKHIMEDHLLAYSWSPPAHLEPAPGSRDELGALVKAWIAAGAACPPS